MEISKYRNEVSQFVGKEVRGKGVFYILALFFVLAASASPEEMPQADVDATNQEVHLSLAECVRLALKNNPSILLEKTKGPIENSLKVMNIIYKVHKTYWDLVAEQEKCKIAKKRNEHATRLLQSVRIRVAVADLAPIEIDRAELQAVNAKVGIFVIESFVQGYSDNLLRLTNAASGKDMWEKVIVPTDRLTPSEESVDVEKGIKQAFENRPDYLAAEQKVEDTGNNEDRLALKSIKQEMIANIRELARQVETTILEVNAARKAKNLARKLLSAEGRKMEVGKSTTWNVIRAEGEFAATEAKETEVLARHRNALAALELAKGTILRSLKDAPAPAGK